MNHLSIEYGVLIEKVPYKKLAEKFPSEKYEGEFAEINGRDVEGNRDRDPLFISFGILEEGPFPSHPVEASVIMGKILYEFPKAEITWGCIRTYR